MPIELSLTDMPEVALNEITEYLDFPEILSLRKVCHYLRHFIDAMKSKSTLKDINITLHPDKITLEYFSVQGEIYKIQYRKSEDTKGTVLIYEETRTSLRNQNFLDLSLKDLEIILKSQKSLIRLIRIIGSDQDQYISRLSEILKSRSDPLQMEEFHMYIESDEKEIMQILPLLDEKSIVSILIYGNSETTKSLKIDEIVKLNQWKNSEQLHIDTFIVDIRSCGVNVLGHFSLVEIKLDRISTEEVLELKEIFLHSPPFAHCHFKANHVEDNLSFLQSNVTNKVNSTVIEKPEKQWFYGSLGTEDIIRVSYTEQNKSFAYRKMRKSEVPDYVEVLF